MGISCKCTPDIGSRSENKLAEDIIQVKTYEYDAFQKTTKITKVSRIGKEIDCKFSQQTDIQENFYDAE
ncbi:MAG: hypothetical protein GX915_09580 [Clostridiales bacterium]|jgi:hypothetical protein|nr:hypothetical protein [Clostridiales bacterium]